MSETQTASIPVASPVAPPVMDRPALGGLPTEVLQQYRKARRDKFESRLPNVPQLQGDRNSLVRLTWFNGTALVLNLNAVGFWQFAHPGNQAVFNALVVAAAGNGALFARNGLTAAAIGERISRINRASRLIRDDGEAPAIEAAIKKANAPIARTKVASKLLKKTLRNFDRKLMGR